MRNKKHQNCVILHIPHSSTNIPKWYYDKCLLSRTDLNVFNKQCVDLYTDKLFNVSGCAKILFKYSRIVCDVEKYCDDEKEVASRYGLGYVYTLDYDGNDLIKATDKYKNMIYRNYYKPYHDHASDVIYKVSKKSNTVIILDCHSFSNAVPYINSNDDVDICIGYNDSFSSDILNNFTYEFFSNKGYNCKINQPFSGSYIPNMLYSEKIENIFSIMLEINKTLYLENNKKSKSYKKVKKDILEYVNKVKTLSLN